jgi:hypothetical protein
MIDTRINDAEEVLMRYKRYLMEFHSPTFPRGHVEELVETLEEVLDMLAEMYATYEPTLEPDQSPDYETSDDDDNDFYMEPEADDF